MAFNAPTSWAFELTVFIYGLHYSFALAYAHKHDTHVSIDVFESRLPKKARTILRIITNFILFLPTIGLLTFYTRQSWHLFRGSSGNMLQAPGHRLSIRYKTLMAIGFLLFFLQGIAKLIQDIRSLKEIL